MNAEVWRVCVCVRECMRRAETQSCPPNVCVGFMWYWYSFPILHALCATIPYPYALTGEPRAVSLHRIHDEKLWSRKNIGAQNLPHFPRVVSVFYFACEHQANGQQGELEWKHDTSHHHRHNNNGAQMHRATMSNAERNALPFIPTYCSCLRLWFIAEFVDELFCTNGHADDTGCLFYWFLVKNWYRHVC